MVANAHPPAHHGACAEERSMSETVAPPRPAAASERGPGYDEDFALWSAHQAALIRAGRFDLVDLENVAEEIESLGRSDRRQLQRRLEVLIMHLLKWRYQPTHRSRRWQLTLVDQRSRIERLLRESPSLRRELDRLLDEAYPCARRMASAETGLALRTFPRACPYAVEQVLDPDFVPGTIDLDP
jgi:hypothetical protein